MKYPYHSSGFGARLRQLALASLLVTGTVGTAHAQLPYAATGVTNTPGTYTDLAATGTAIATANTDDANSAATPIGFTFSYNGTAFTDFVLNTNGFIKLGTVAPTGAQFSDGGQSTANGPLASTDTNLLLPFNQDLTAGSAGGTEYRVATTGTAPNRICTIQWKNISDKARGTFATQYANFSFQVKLYEAGSQIDFVYGTATPGAVAGDVAKFCIVGIKGTDGSAAQSIVGTKPSGSAWSATLFSAGAYAAGTNGHNVRGTVPPDAGRTYRFSVQVANDAAAAAIQGYASVVVPASNPITLRAVVRNVGTTALATATTVTLTISGANSYTQTQTVSPLALGASDLATFTGITLANVGQNTVTISIPNDGNNSNNSFSQPMETSATTISLATPGAGSGGSVFQAGADSYYAAKLTFNTARSISSVTALISDAGNQATAKTSVGEVVYGVVIDATTGALLARSPDYVITQADVNVFHTFVLSGSATVPAGDVLVGMGQAASSGALPFYPFGVQAEDPNRPNTYYTGSTTAPAAPTLALTAATSAIFKFPFGAVTGAPALNDVAVGEIQGYGSIAVPVGNPFGLRAVVRNAGLNAINTPVTVTLTISGANTFTQTKSVASLGVGASSFLTFTNISLPNVGANTVTVTVPNDDVNGNNSNAQAMATSATRFSFIAPGIAPANAYGPGTVARTAAFCTKFTLNATRDVTAVRAFIYNDPNLVPNATNGQRTTVVYGVVLNATTGAVIARSPDYTIVATDLGQLHTFNLAGSVPAGDFLAGMAIIVPAGLSAGVFPVAYQAETPARPGLFYTATLPATTAPTDVASFNARFMIEAETATPGSCPAPTALNITGSTSTTATFGFPAATGATGYQIVYGPTGFTPGGTGSTTSPTFTGTTYTLNGLTPSTGYDFYIRTICSPTDQSGLTGPVRLTTPCTPPVVSTFPYTQNFDTLLTGQTAPCGINVLDSNNDGFTWQARATVDASLATGNIARSAPNAMVYSYNNIGPTPTVGADDWFFTPALTLSNTQRYRVSFYYRTAGQGLVERLEVKYGPAATPTGQTTTIYTNNNIGNTIYLNATNTSTVAVADITPASGTYYVGFHATSTANQGFLAIDDLTITAGPLATSEALKRAVSVYPNPSNSGQFNLEIHGANAAQLAVEVTNLLGQRVYTGTAKDNLRNTVDLSALTSGIYVLKVRNGQEYTQQQISIVK